MVARRFEDLIIWQLAYKVQQGVFAFTAKPPASKDFKYCNQIRESSRSARKNMSEGFGRFYPKEFARFLHNAVGSLNETKDHLLEGHELKYVDDAEFERLFRLTLRAIKGSNRFIAYLRQAKAPEPFWRVRNPDEKPSDTGNPFEPFELSEPFEPSEPTEPSEPSEPT
jgi:four helix bundle protein